MLGGVLLKQQFLDSIRVQKIVQRQVPEHDEDRIGSVLSVCSGSRPRRSIECLEAAHQDRSIRHVPIEARIQIHAQQQVIWVLIARRVWLNYRFRLAEHVVEPIEEQRVNMREVARVFVRRPPSC